MSIDIAKTPSIRVDIPPVFIILNKNKLTLHNYVKSLNLFLCSVCTTGYEGDSSGCSACPYGRYKDFDGAGNCTSCGADANTTTYASTNVFDCREYTSVTILDVTFYQLHM